jgi:2,3-bisphosphoglycerate-independent phosphoglycerate mutase
MLSDLILSTESRIVFLVLDGVGDIPNPTYNFLTPLEAAKKPNMDLLAMGKGVLGRIIPVGIGVTPGSGPGHLSLFGYDPIQFSIGRGILEVLGLNMDLQANDLAARGNFCTMRDGVVVDRRAGRIATSETERLCKKIGAALPEVEGYKVVLAPGKSHRFAVIFRGQGLSDELDDADPHKGGKPPIPAKAKTPQADKAALTVNAFIQKAAEVLKDEPVANGILLRGFSLRPDIPQFSERYAMDALAIATYPMYRGIAKVLGMKVEHEPQDYGDSVAILKRHFNDYRFFFVHIKETDTAGEDGNFPAKVEAIEAVDRIIPEIVALQPDVLVVTGDHSTPCPLKGHSWHPVPLLMASNSYAAGRDGLAFHEKNCVKGSIGTIYSKDLMAMALACSLKLDKYGA